MLYRQREQEEAKKEEQAQEHAKYKKILFQQDMNQEQELEAEEEVDNEKLSPWRSRKPSPRPSLCNDMDQVTNANVDGSPIPVTLSWQMDGVTIRRLIGNAPHAPTGA